MNMAGKPKCFVPQCKKTVGVLFPKNAESRKKWLKALMLEHLEPDSSSFVCLDHFGKNGLPLLRQKFVTPSSQMQFAKKEKPSEILRKEPTIVQYPNKCRLCMVQGSTVTQHIFTHLNNKITIAEAIRICLYPLKVSADDNLSKHVCAKCLKLLKDYFNFHQHCIAMDAKQRLQADFQSSSNTRIINQYPRASSLENQTHNRHESSSKDCDANSEVSGEYLHEEWLSDYEEGNKENKKEELKHDNSKNNSRQDKLSELINDTFKSVDKENEELLQVLEGEDTDFNFSAEDSANNDLLEDDRLQPTDSRDDGGFTESIVIEMVNDEEQNLSTDVANQELYSSEENEWSLDPTDGTIKRKLNVNGQSPKKLRLSSHSQSYDSDASGLEVDESFQSKLGHVTFSKTIKYLFDSRFIHADGYLYDTKFTKRNIRHLRCTVQKCPGAAIQKRLQTLEYATEIEVVTPHNHKALDQKEIKRQMFYSIIYRKMRRDKFFNFKVLYEQFCKLDPSIEKILPLQVVIKEICNMGPPALPAKLDSFEDFYSRIENDEFNSIHFTDGQAQFYLDRFETDDGGKAIVFGNENVVHRYRHCKLMFVDASFFIESDFFPYQLVTVMVNKDNNYIPIFYALINLKSQELYRKIFGFLVSYAPELRPTEIVTDFEANLYYALGEIYTEASIGGAVYYFAQNIYKKICSLNLAKELEVDSNFRNIYHMILMLPLLPVDTIAGALKSIEKQAKNLRLTTCTEELFNHIHTEWMQKVTPEMFCVHRLPNRITEGLTPPFRKLKDFIMMAKAKKNRSDAPFSIVTTVEKLKDLDKFMRETYTDSISIKTFNKDMSGAQKKNIIKAWNFIKSRSTINIYQFFVKVLGYINCMESQLWIWGFYHFTGKFEEHLIDGASLALVNGERNDAGTVQEAGDELQEEEQTEIIEEYYIEEESGAVRKIHVRQPATVDFSIDSEREIEEEIFGPEEEFES